MSPFKSKSQQKWMYANKPKPAKHWVKHTPNIKKLPNRIKHNKKRNGKLQ